MLTADAIKKIVDLGEAKLLTIEGRNYTDKVVHAAKIPEVETLHVATLGGFIKAVSAAQKSAIIKPHQWRIHIIDPDNVELVSEPTSDWHNRDKFVTASTELSVEQYPFGHRVDIENFIIYMRTRFVQTPQVDAIVKLIGTMSQEAVKTSDDDGFTQKVSTRSGVIIHADKTSVPNPVMLKPYRTFLEVDQPESPFIMRLHNEQTGTKISLHEADGGKWKLFAMRNIYDFLTETIERVDALKDFEIIL